MAKLSHLEKEYIKANHKNKTADELSKKLEKDKELIEEYINNLQNKNDKKTSEENKRHSIRISSDDNNLLHLQKEGDVFVKGDAIVFQYTQITIKHIVTDAITNGKIEKDSSFVETKLLSIIPFDSSRRTISE